MQDLKRVIYGLVPNQIRRMVDAILVQKYLAIKNKVLAENYFELEPLHIRNLKMVTDRDSLLDLLPKGQTICEIGVDRGDFTEKIIERTNPRKFHLIDLWASTRYPEEKYNFVESRFKREISEGIVQIERGYSIEMLEHFDDNYFNWAYLDSGHGFEMTLDELMLLERKVKRDGLILGHDYCRFSNDGGARFGVVEAVNKFCVEREFEFIFLTMETHRHLSFAIRRII